MAESEDYRVLLVEVSAAGISIEGEMVIDLIAKLKSVKECSKVHFLVDSDVETPKIVELLNIARQANCENVSVQSLPST